MKAIHFPCVVLALALLVPISGTVSAQTNLALSATASDSGGGTAPNGYGSANMNDGNASTYQWISTNANPDPNAYARLTWSTPQSITSITMILRTYFNGRLLDSATIQYWDSSTSTWQSDQTFPSQSGAIQFSINLTQARTTTMLQLTNMVTVGSQSSNPWIGEFEAYGTAALAAPASISVPASSNTGNYTVSWSAVSAATSYDLQEDTNGSFTAPTTVYSGANTSFNVSGKGNGSYYYRVRAVNASGSSAWTVGANPCVVLLPPAAPASITVPATSLSGNYTVSWSAGTAAPGPTPRPWRQTRT
jgi:hypothetical protein